MQSQETLICPPTDGTVLLHDTLSFHKKHNADAALFLFMQDDADDLTRVTYAQFERASRHIRRFTGTNTNSPRPVVAVIALTDTLVYHTIVVGVMAAGFIPFPISPRNTVQAIVNLLRITSCHRLLATSNTLKDLIIHIQMELMLTEPPYSLFITEAPDFFDLFPELQKRRSAQHDEPEILSPFTTASKPGLSDIALYLHSSGSTGFPKAIPRTHRDLIQQMSSPCLVDIPNRSTRARVAGMQLPPFHALGIVIQLYAPLFTCISMVLFPPVVGSTQTLPVIPTPENVQHHFMRTGCNVIVTVPTFLGGWAKEPTAVSALRDMELVIFSGGGLSEKLGDALVQSGIVLRNIYGGTEFGSPGYSSTRLGDEMEWEYFEFSKDSEVVWAAQGGETYECQLFTTPNHFVSVYNMPDREGFATKDIFRQHPIKKYLWKIVGRLDDVIIHSSGEKTVPSPMESIMMSSAHIMGVTMFGSKHDQVGVLVEPSPPNQIDITDAQQVAHFINLIWPVIYEANQRAPAFSKIYKEMILVTDRNKPLPRTPKGTVMRALALKAYATEIEERYTDVVFMRDGELAEPPQVWDRDCLVQWLLRQVRELCPGVDISLNKSLFDQGIDSSSAFILRRRIVVTLASALSHNTHWQNMSMAQNMVYRYPTINALAIYVLRLAQEHDAPASESDIHAHVQAIEDMVRKYSLPPAPSASSDTVRGVRDPVVLITGSTGHLGAHILQQLLRDQRVKRVYTLNRVAPLGRATASRHLDRFRDLGLDEQLLCSGALVHIEADTAAERLGLGSALYEGLCSRVTAVIHLAWALDFNFPLAAFEAHVRGTHNLLALAGASGAHFVFASSVGVAQGWEQSAGRYPEEVVLDAKFAVGNGYGEGKYVAERIIASSGVNATSLRIGQISGSGNGAWAVSDWVPILVKSGLALGYLPRAHGTVSWLPPQIVAICILDVMWHVGRAPAALNVVHPRGILWDTVMERISEALDRTLGVRLPLVPFVEWFDLLEKRAKLAGREDVENIPGIKLLDFFRNLRDGDLAIPQDARESEACSAPQFSIVNAEALSSALADAPPLAFTDATSWVEYWRASGFLAL